MAKGHSGEKGLNPIVPREGTRGLQPITPTTMVPTGTGPGTAGIQPIVPTGIVKPTGSGKK